MVFDLSGKAVLSVGSSARLGSWFAIGRVVNIGIGIIYYGVGRMSSVAITVDSTATAKMNFIFMLRYFKDFQ
jgi:hypothetical protein